MAVKMAESMRNRSFWMAEWRSGIGNPDGGGYGGEGVTEFLGGIVFFLTPDTLFSQENMFLHGDLYPRLGL